MTAAAMWGWRILVGLSGLLVLNGVGLYLVVVETQTERTIGVLLAAFGAMGLMVALEGLRHGTRWAWTTSWVVVGSLAAVGLHMLRGDRPRAHLPVPRGGRPRRPAACRQGGRPVTRYELFKLLHIVGAIAWIGGGMGLLVLTRRFIAARDYAALLSVGKHGQALGTWLFMPASFLTIGFGVAMVVTEPTLRFTDLWILIGFGGVVASGIAQMAAAAPAEKRFTALAREHGLDHPDVATAARKVTIGSAFDLGLLLLVVWAMVAKPTL